MPERMPGLSGDTRNSFKICSRMHNQCCRSVSQVIRNQTARRHSTVNDANILAEVARHYPNRALEESNQNKTKTAKLAGLASYQTFDNWLEKYQRIELFKFLKNLDFF